MLMDEGLDSGDILGLKYIKINQDTLVTDLFDKLSDIASSLTIEVLKKFDYILPKKQKLVFSFTLWKSKKIIWIDRV